MIKTTYLFFAADGSPPEIIEHQPELQQSAKIVGILAAELTASFIRDCPLAQIKYLSKTLPFLVEDSVASPIDTMHCVSQPIGNSQIRVLTTSRDTVLQCLNQADALGLKVDQLYIDADLIAVSPDDIKTRVITLIERQLIKTANGLVAAIGEQDSAVGIQELQSAQPEQVETRHYQTFCTDAIEQAETSVCPPVNLLQGEFTPRQSAMVRAATVHKVLLVAVVIFFVQMSYWMIVGVSYKDKAEVLRQKSEQIYQGFFPGEKKIVDLIAQAEGRLIQANTRTPRHSFLALLAELGEAIKTSEEGSVILLKSVHYEQTTGQLRAELAANQVTELERVQEQLRKNSGLIAQTDHISENPGKAEKLSAKMRLTLKTRPNGAVR